MRSDLSCDARGAVIDRLAGETRVTLADTGAQIGE